MSEELDLTDREKAVAEHAATLATKRIADEFYQQVGRTVVNRLLIVVGAVLIGIAYGKGWIKF